MRRANSLLPSVQLVITSERDTLLEPSVRVGGPPERVSSHLQSKRHVEVLRDVRLGPDLGETVVGVDEAGVLDGRPSEEGVVTDEGSDLSVGATKRDGLVETTRGEHA